MCTVYSYPHLAGLINLWKAHWSSSSPSRPWLSILRTLGNTCVSTHALSPTTRWWLSRLHIDQDVAKHVRIYIMAANSVQLQSVIGRDRMERHSMVFVVCLVGCLVSMVSGGLTSTNSQWRRHRWWQLHRFPSQLFHLSFFHLSFFISKENFTRLFLRKCTH